MAGLEMRPDWEAVKRRFDALWNREIVDRCCVAATSWRDGASPDAVDPADTSDPEDLRDWWENPQRILRRSVSQLERRAFYGEALPVVCHYYAPAGHAAYFGGRYEYTPETVWYHPVFTDIEREPPRFDPHHPQLAKHIAVYGMLARAAAGKFLISMPDNVGAADALAHLYGSEQLLIDMASRPEAVERAIRAVNQGWRHCAEAYYDAVRDPDGGSSVGWLSTWGRGRHMQMQCDLSVMVSPRHFERFLVPELEEQMDWIEYPLYHLDGEEQVRHLDLLLSLKRLRMIQWTNVAGQERASNYIPVFRRIQAAGKCLLLSVERDELDLVMTELSSRGLFLRMNTRSEEESREVLRFVASHTRD